MTNRKIYLTVRKLNTRLYNSAQRVIRICRPTSDEYATAHITTGYACGYQHKRPTGSRKQKRAYSIRPSLQSEK